MNDEKIEVSLETFRKKLEDFDETFECLVEYFAVIGFD